PFSCAGSTRASTAVLSQIEPTPGAVIAAQAEPEDCGALPPLASFSASSCDSVSVAGWRATVMSAPTRASHNGDSGCFTETAAEPLGLSLDDHDMSLLAAACGERAFESGPVVSVEASTLSGLQSSSRPLMSASSASGAAAAAAAGISGLSSAGTVCAPACSDATLKPAAHISSTIRPCRIWETI